MYTELVTAKYPGRSIEYINKGIGGNKVTDMKERWRDDVLYHKPDRLSIKIGINDLHGFLGDTPEAVSPELFAEVYEELLELTKSEVGCPVVLLTPFYISRDTGRDTFRSQVLELIPRYIATVEKMSAQFDTRLVKLHDIFQSHLNHRDADTFCPEPVHPNHAGHTVIAQALLEATES